MTVTAELFTEFTVCPAAVEQTRFSGISLIKTHIFFSDINETLLYVCLRAFPLMYVVNLFRCVYCKMAVSDRR